MRGRDVTGRFTTNYEVTSIGDGITADLQNPVGQSVLWWVFNPDATQVDPTYDVGSYWSHGRVWFTPFEIPVVLATIEQGVGGHNERGLYTVDMLRLVINTPEILPFIPSIVWEPDKHLNDRVEYRGGLFQPTLVYPKGHVQHDMVVIQVELEQIKDDQTVNDTQFNGNVRYPSPFAPAAFNPTEFSGPAYPGNPVQTEGTRDVEEVAHIERWGEHTAHSSDTNTGDIYTA